MKKLKQLTLEQTLPYILAIGGAIGLFSAAKLTLEKIRLLENPFTQLGCDLNPIIACGSVINTDQASAFGFPNPFMGIAGFAALTTIGMALLAGARFKRWFWLGLQLGTIFGAVFIHWLIYQTIFNIGALCPYCMVVWSVTMPIFWYVTLHNLREGHIKVTGRLKRIGDFAQRHHGEILITWFVAVAGLILWQFWYYWETLL